KREVQILVAVEERPIRMIEEVIAGEAELQLSALRLSEREVFEQGYIGVEETGTGQNRPDVIALLTRGYERREAGGVNVLVCLKPASRIAGQRRHQGEVGSSKGVGRISLNGYSERLAHEGCTSGDKSSVAKIGTDGCL